MLWLLMLAYNMSQVGSRLAANMAKLAACRKASSTAAAPLALPAATAANQEVAKQPAAVREEGKKSAIPEDIKRKLLAKVRLIMLHRSDLI